MPLSAQNLNPEGAKPCGSRFIKYANRSPASPKPRARHASLESLEGANSSPTPISSSLLPANDGDSSNGFVATGIVNGGRLSSTSQGYDPVGDVNQDGIDDYFITSWGTRTSIQALGRAC